MQIDISARFSFIVRQPTDVLLQFEAARIPEQEILAENTVITVGLHHARVPAQDTIGERVWLASDGEVEVSYTAKIAVKRQMADITTLQRMAPHNLPGETVPYLLPSAYCPSGRFENFTETEFGQITGGAKIDAMRQWIADHFSYQPGCSTADTTAMDSFIERRGVCRDYSHVLITMARAAGIPARYVSVYAPGVQPQDFHAVAEVFLADPQGPSGSWHLVDATGMAGAGEMVKIGVGRDAADVSFLTCFGPCEFGGAQVNATLA